MRTPMTMPTATRWAPRLAGVSVALFLASSALAAWYAATTWYRLDWAVTISGPVLVVAVLYALAFRLRRRAGAA